MRSFVFLISQPQVEFVLEERVLLAVKRSICWKFKSSSGRKGATVPLAVACRSPIEESNTVLIEHRHTSVTRAHFQGQMFDLLSRPRNAATRVTHTLSHRHTFGTIAPLCRSHSTQLSDQQILLIAIQRPRHQPLSWQVLLASSVNIRSDNTLISTRSSVARQLLALHNGRPNTILLHTATC